MPAVELRHGDALEVLRSMDNNSVDAMVTDPPAGIAFMNRKWDKTPGRDAFVVALAAVFAEARRVVRPGGHAFVWALPRTCGWTQAALEDAGWEVRDCICHLFGSGFPKSHNVGKAIDKAAGVERVVTGRRQVTRDFQTVPTLEHPYKGQQYGRVEVSHGTSIDVTAPVTFEAAQWEGWGTALKPAVEFWFLARAPLSEKTIAANVLAHGTGALNIDACRIPTGEQLGRHNHVGPYTSARTWSTSATPPRDNRADPPSGRWPPNLLLTHSADCGEECAPDCPVAEIGQQSGESKSKAGMFCGWRGKDKHEGWKRPAHIDYPDIAGGYNDTGTAARFFPQFRYQAKPSRRERDAGLEGIEKTRQKSYEGGPIVSGNSQTPGGSAVKSNHHPTVKSIELMRWLCRLITPPEGTVLDPFMGSGTTGCAAVLEGFGFVGVEADIEYHEIAQRRIAHWATQAVQPPLEEMGA